MRRVKLFVLCWFFGPVHSPRLRKAVEPSAGAYFGAPLGGGAQEFSDVEEVPFDFSAIKEDLESRRSSYDGDLVSTRQSIVCELVVATWPLVGEVAVCPITDHIDDHLAAELLDPRSCLRPVEDWPSQTPRAVVFAEDHEWFSTVKVVWERGMMVPIDDVFLINWVPWSLMGPWLSQS